MDKIGKYTILGEIGEGAMGVVYKALDPVLHRHVAIKTISASLKADNDLRERFAREARAAGSLNHPNIITIHDFGEEQGKIYMAMELLEGTDLRDLIAAGTPMTIEEKLAIMEQVCDGLAFAHSKGIIHRDLKPGNIHIQPNGQVKVLDFGLARLDSSDMTKTGLVMGTPNYMSPEQVLGEKVDTRSDIFSTGAVFYELLTNHKPFAADSVHTVMFQVVHKEAPPIRQWAPDVPAPLVQIVERAMQKDRTKRFQSAAALRQAVANFRQGLASQSFGSMRPVEEATEVLEVVDEGMAPYVEAPSAPHDPGSRSGPPSAPRSPSASGVHETRSLRPQPAPSLPPAPAPSTPASRLPLYVGAAFLMVAGAAGTVAWLRLEKAAPVPSPTSDVTRAEMGALTEALVSTQIELARRDLEDKDYAKAASQAERVLKLSPNNAEAKAIMDQAKAVQGELETAAATARAAVDAGDTDTASQALSRVLALDPEHPAAAELTGRLNRFFKSQAEEGRNLMLQAREAAQAAKGAGSEPYEQAAALGKQGEAQLASGEFAAATRQFLQARDGYDRARRAAQQKAAEVARPTTPAATTAPAAAQATLPAASLPPVTGPAATAPPPTAPPVPPRPFQAMPTAIEGPSQAQAGPGGFDTGGVKVAKPAEAQGALEITSRPEAVRPGETATLAIAFANTGKKDVRIKTVTVVAVVNGKRSALAPRVMAREVGAGKKAVLAEASASFPESGTWSLEVTVQTEKGDTVRSELKWM